VNKDYILKTGSILSKGVDEGWGSSPSYNPADVATKAKLKQSAYIFSSAKNVAFQQELANNLRDADGKLRSFHEFKKMALEKDSTYNKTYLQTEYQTAVASSAAAKKWAGYERRAQRYPNLEYKTVGDGHVRDAHRALHGIIRPITHAFWNSYYPPNGWRCRCYVVQTDRNPNGDFSPEPDEKTVPKYFRLNSGKTGDALPSGHPYFKALGDANANLTDDVIKNIPFEKVKDYSNGSELWVHPFHDLGKDDQMLKNLATANIMAKAEKCSLKLMPTTGDKSPEFLKDGIHGDRYECKGLASVRNVYEGSKAKFSPGNQLHAFDDAFVAFDFTDTFLNAKDINLMARYLNGKMLKKTSNTFNYLLYKEKIVRIDRDMGFDAMEAAIKALWAN
jgi:SPP1 gp7 family putative phage head morphogenesis protein